MCLPCVEGHQQEDEKCVWETDRESVWLKVTRGLHCKAEVPLMRSEETVGSQPPSVEGGADQQHYCQCWCDFTTWDYDQIVFLLENVHLQHNLDKQTPSSGLFFFKLDQSNATPILMPILMPLRRNILESPAPPPPHPTPPRPAPPACSTHLPHLIAIRVNESPWKKQALKAYLHRVKMQVAADVKLHFPPVFINPMFAERLLRIWDGWLRFCLCSALQNWLKSSESQSTTLKVCSTW